jgi:LPS sulfotransferase NodH
VRHLLVIGAQRCGTTYLHDLLDAHPRIAMARPARPEPKVFLSAEQSARGRDWYVATWFADAGDVDLLGDKSTSYLEHPEAAARARAMLGDPRVHVQFRDPVQRAVSNWAFSTDHGHEDRPLGEALEACLAEDAEDAGDGGGGRGAAARSGWEGGTSVSPFAYLRRGRYAEQLRPWLAEYGDDVTVSFLEELVADPAAVARTYRDLGVDDAFAPDLPDAPVNASAAGGEALDPGLVARLREYFRAPDEDLAALLGRPLPWT